MYNIYICICTLMQLLIHQSTDTGIAYMQMHIYIYIGCKVKSWSKIWGFIS